MSKGKPESIVKSNAMEVDSGREVQPSWALGIQSFSRTHEIIRLRLTLQDRDVRRGRESRQL